MKKFLTGLAAVSLLALQFAPAFANSDSAPVIAEIKPAELPWLYKGSDIPVDDSWTFGELDNGLRYAVKKNDVPSGQVAIRVRIDAGSLHEEDDEQGYAHLLEHLSFRGSEFVPDGESKRIWQRFGVSFGSDSNAHTSPTETVYKLDLPNSSPEKLDESMKILSGMMRAPSLSQAALDAERAIVLAEMRESSGAFKEMGDAQRAHFFRGQRYAERSPIGTQQTLNASNVDGLKAFHKRWYRPDKTVVVIAGDADAAILEAQVKKHFSSWSGEGPPAPEPDFGKPTAEGKKAAIFVEPTLPLSVAIGWMKPWEKVDDTVVYNQQIIIDALAIRIINRRLEEQARNSGSFLQAEAGSDDLYRSADITTLSLRPVGDDWEKAVKLVRSTVADAISFAPSQADIDREYTILDRIFQTRFESYPFEAAATQADDIVNAVDIRETVATPKTALDIYRAMANLVTPERILDSTRKLFASDAVRVFMTSPTEVKNGAARLAAALDANVISDGSARLAQDKPTFDDLPALGSAGKIARRVPIKEFGMELLRFENGVQALLFPNKAEVGQVRLVSRFGRGYQAISPKQADLLWTGPAVINENGIGKFTQTQIEQMAAGKRIELNFGIDNDAFEYTATTGTLDLANQLKVIATKMENPGWQDAPIQRAKAFVKSGYGSFETSADAVLQRDLEYLISNSDKRWKTPTPDEAAKITPAAVRKFWEPLLATGPVEVILMGDFETEEAVKILGETFGAMKLRKPGTVSAEAQALSFPAANVTPLVRQHVGPKDQAAAVIAWPTAGGLARITESRELEVLAAIFRDRLFEKFRAEQAASYSPNMANKWPEEFSSGGYLMAISQVQPQDVDRFYKFAEAVASDLAANPVSADELQRSVEPIKQLIDRISSGNSFWINSLQGATFNQEKFTALGSIFVDYEAVTPERLQELAKRYFVIDRAWKFTVLPKNAAEPGAAAAATNR